MNAVTPTIALPNTDRFQIPPELKAHYVGPAWTNWATVCDPAATDRIAKWLIRNELSQDPIAQRDKLPGGDRHSPPDEVRAWNYQPSDEELDHAVSLVTDEDRLWWLHAAQIAEAEKAKAAADERDTANAAAHADKACVVCSTYSTSTVPWSITEGRVRRGITGARRDGICAACALAMDAELLRRAAAEKVGRKTRQDLAAAWLNAK